MRASMSHAPRRISSKRVGSKLYSLDGSADDGVEPDVRELLRRRRPRSRCRRRVRRHAARGRRTSPAMRPSNVSGGSTMWSSTEMTVYRRSGAVAVRAGTSPCRSGLPPSVKPSCAGVLRVGTVPIGVRDAVSVEHVGLGQQLRAPRRPSRRRRARSSSDAFIAAAHRGRDRHAAPVPSEHTS